MRGACDICGQAGCNRLNPQHNIIDKEKLVMAQVRAPHDVVVETSPGAGVKVIAEGTMISEALAAEHGIATTKPKAEVAPAAPKPAGKRKTTETRPAKVETRPKVVEQH